jgi:hypothetical protein
VDAGPEQSDESAPVTRLVGIYDADGTLAGELSYWVGARLGRRHCALCDVTHGTFREKSEWRDVRERLPVPFTAVHLDERDELEAKASLGQEPCVIAVRADGSASVAVSRESLERCEGSPAALGDLLLAIS